MDIDLSSCQLCFQVVPRQGRKNQKWRMITVGVLGLEYNDSHVDPKWLIVKWWPKKDATIGRIGLVSHHLGSLLGAIELNVLYAK